MSKSGARVRACVLVHAYLRLLKQTRISSGNVHVLSEPASSEPVPSDDPTTLLARAFKLEEVMNLLRVSLQENDCQCHPELLQRRLCV